MSQGASAPDPRAWQSLATTQTRTSSGYAVRVFTNAQTSILLNLGTSLLSSQQPFGTERMAIRHRVHLKPDRSIVIRTHQNDISTF